MEPARDRHDRRGLRSSRAGPRSSGRSSSPIRAGPTSCRAATPERWPRCSGTTQCRRGRRPSRIPRTSRSQARPNWTWLPLPTSPEYPPTRSEATYGEGIRQPPMTDLVAAVVLSLTPSCGWICRHAMPLNTCRIMAKRTLSAASMTGRRGRHVPILLVRPAHRASSSSFGMSCNPI